MVLNVKVMEQIKIIELTAIPRTHTHTHTLTRVCICQKKKPHVDADDNLKYNQTNTPIFAVF